MMRALMFIVGFALGTLRYIVGRVVFITAVAVWVMGWVLAQGFWSTLVAIICPPWGWYLLAERLATRFGLL